MVHEKLGVCVCFSGVGACFRLLQSSRLFVFVLSCGFIGLNATGGDTTFKGVGDMTFKCNLFGFVLTLLMLVLTFSVGV